MKVPREKTKQTLELILECAKDVGFLRDVKGNLYVDLDGTATPSSQEANGELPADGEEKLNGNHTVTSLIAAQPAPPLSAQVKPLSSRVFITHGKNKEIVGQIKELLTFGKFLPVVSEEQETVSKPVSDKVMDDMRSCSAAIVHVGTELKLLDADGKE